MSVRYYCENNQIFLIGKTYPIKDHIKQMGGKFDPTQKIWYLSYSEENLKKIQDFCDDPKTGEPVPRTIVPTPPSPNLSQTLDNPDYTIKNLVSKVAQLIEEEFLLPKWIIGEVQNLTVRKDSFFLELCEPKNQHSGLTESGAFVVKGTLWSSTIGTLIATLGKDLVKELLQDGMKIRVFAQVQFYRERSQLSLNILNIDPSYTKGQLALEREKLLKKLRQEGLVDANKKLFIPPFALKIGLVSAYPSRAYSDFTDQIAMMNFPGEIIFAAAATQGEKVLTSIPQAIQSLVEKKCDVIVITRGGGGASDLRWFDTPQVAYAIAQCPIPIVAAIGHHDDICVAEEIAFHREKTPTAAADYIVQLFQRDFLNIERYQQLLIDILGQWERKWSDRLQKNVQFFQEVIQRKVLQMELTINDIEKNLIKLDPTSWLDKGWMQVFSFRNQGKERISTTYEFNENETLSLVGKQGTVQVKVVEKLRKETHE